jgi:hypothetical protein
MSWDDFTRTEYRSLLRLARAKWSFQGYADFDRGCRFILWRHDVDFSLHSSVALARIEAEEGVRSTYFLHLHSLFYNLLEPSLGEMARELLSLGHEIGLHFDSHYHGIATEERLDETIRWEAAIVEHVVHAAVRAFSFHNTTPFTMSCQNPTYGGLINTYAAYFQREVTYASDSNGYWRNRRLRDVLEDESIDKLQVLTHPGWWQERSSPPRERVWRCVAGRAAQTMETYDQALVEFGRANVYGPSSALLFMRERQPRRYRFLDEVWNTRSLNTLFLELHHLQEFEIRQLAESVFRNDWRVPTSAIDSFFSQALNRIAGWKLLKAVLPDAWQDVTGGSDKEQKHWTLIRDQVSQGTAKISSANLEEGCVYLCGILEKLGQWTDRYCKEDGPDAVGGAVPVSEKVKVGKLVSTSDDHPAAASRPLDPRWSDFKKAVTD